MHCVGAGLECGLDDRLDSQVALGWGRRSQTDRVVGQPHMRGQRIRVAVDGDRLHAHLSTGPDDADGDLAPVGDEDAAERRAHRLATVFAQRRTSAGLRAGCCHASFAGS